MKLWQEYKRPRSISEAIKDLTSSTGTAVPIAGGTDLLLEMRQSRHSTVHTIIDLTGIPEMTNIELRKEELFIGAAVPLSYIASDLQVGFHAKALVEACDLIAGPQVRNVATLGGNVAHALPAADGTIALTALDAAVDIAGANGIQRRSLTSLFLGPGKSAIDKTSELIVGFAIRTQAEKREGLVNPAYTASCFKRIMRPQGVALPILNCAIWLAREQDRIQDVRIAIGPGGPIPFRATLAEDELRGKLFDDVAATRAFELVLDQARFRTSARRASQEYRQSVANGLFKEVLHTAWERAA